jgi:HEPN domain-containing protein
VSKGHRARELDLDKEIIDSTLELTVDYTFSRYPDVAERVPYEEYDEEMAKDKVKIAEGIFESLKRFYKALLERGNG